MLQILNVLSLVLATLLEAVHALHVSEARKAGNFMNLNLKLDKPGSALDTVYCVHVLKYIVQVLVHMHVELNNLQDCTGHNVENKLMILY